MKAKFILTAISVGLTSVVLGLAQSPQPKSNQTLSLGALARKLRAERAKEGVKAVKVFTNDNLPTAPPGESEPIAEPGSKSATGQPEKKANGTVATSSSNNSEVHDEKYYRSKMEELQSTLQLHQRELSVLQQKLSQNQMEYYPDPNKTLMQESTPAFYSDQNKLRGEIESKQQQIAADEKAIQDLQDQLQREGGDPGWLR